MNTNSYHVRPTPPGRYNLWKQHTQHTKRCNAPVVGGCPKQPEQRRSPPCRRACWTRASRRRDRRCDYVPPTGCLARAPARQTDQRKKSPAAVVLLVERSKPRAATISYVCTANLGNQGFPDTRLFVQRTSHVHVVHDEGAL